MADSDNYLEYFHTFTRRDDMMGYEEELQEAFVATTDPLTTIRTRFYDWETETWGEFPDPSPNSRSSVWSIRGEKYDTGSLTIHSLEEIEALRGLLDKIEVRLTPPTPEPETEE